MSTARIVLPTPHVGQRQVIREARRYNVLDMGRRWGKTTFGIDRLARPALEGYPVAWFAPEDKFYEEVWRDLLETLRPVITYKNATKHRLDLVGGGAVEIWNMAKPQNVARGRKYKRIVVDEAAQIPYLENAWQQAIRATLIDFEGDAFFLSTPRGYNYFYRLYMNGINADKLIAESSLLGEDGMIIDPKNPDAKQWKAWRFPSYSNPHLPPAELVKMKAELTPKNYSQEVEALFMGEGTSVFPNVEESAKGALRGRIPSHQYTIGVDWGRDNDYTVYTVVDITTRSVVWVESTGKIEFHHQRARLQGLCDRYHPAMILCEMNSIGVPNFEELERLGLPVSPFWATNATKVEAVDALVLALARRQIVLLDKDQRVENIPVGQNGIDELHAYASIRLPSGQIRYAAPEGTHDDMVVSLMLAWLAALRPDLAAFNEEEVKGSLAAHESWNL